MLPSGAAIRLTRPAGSSGPVARLTGPARLRPARSGLAERPCAQGAARTLTQASAQRG